METWVEFIWGRRGGKRVVTVIERLGMEYLV